MSCRQTIAQINTLPLPEFIRIIGPVFENSPWVAEKTWANKPFENRDALHLALCRTVSDSDTAAQLELIRAHPDLAGRAAVAGTLTEESSREQASAGLGRLNAEERAAFHSYNQAYRRKFDFPFVICARLNKKEAILAGFKSRLHHSRDEEIKTALAEIFKIAKLRIDDIIT